MINTMSKEYLDPIDDEQNEDSNEDLGKVAETAEISQLAASSLHSTTTPAEIDANEVTWDSIRTHAQLPFHMVQYVNTAANSIVGGIGIVYAAQRSYLNYLYIVSAKKHLLEEVADIHEGEIEDWFLKNKLEYNNKNKEIALQEIASKKMVSHITQNTISPGIAGSALGASIFIALSLTLPVAAFPLGIVGLTILGGGLIATAIAAYTNRKRLKNKLTNLLKKDPEVRKKINSKSKSLNSELADKKFQVLRKKHKLAEKSTARILSFIAAIKVSYVFEFITTVFRTTAATLQSVATIALTASDALKNHFNRQEKYRKFSRILAESFIPSIHARPYIIFGSSLYDKYILKNQDKLKRILGLDNKTKFYDLLDIIKFKNPDIYIKLQENCIKLHIENDFKKFCNSKKLDPNNSEAFSIFAENKIAQNIKSDVRFNGYLGLTTIGVSFVSLGLMFPPLLLAGMILAAATAISGSVITETIASKEASKFTKKFDRLTDKSINPKDKLTEAKLANKEAKLYIEEIKRITQRNRSYPEISTQKGQKSDNLQQEKIVDITRSNHLTAKRQESRREKRSQNIDRKIISTLAASHPTSGEKANTINHSNIPESISRNRPTALNLSEKKQKTRKSKTHVSRLIEQENENSHLNKR